MKQIRQFLEQKKHVKIAIRYKKRQIVHLDEGRKVMEQILAAIVKGLCEYQKAHLDEIGKSVSLQDVIHVTGGALNPAFIQAKSKWMRNCEYVFNEQSSLKGAAMLENTGRQVPKFQYSVPHPQDEVLTIHIHEAECHLNISAEPAPIPEMNRTNRGNIVWFDMDMLSFPLIIRSVEPGDRLVPFGMPGTQKVKKVLIDRKIPRKQRCCIPILVQGDTILWIAGIRRAAAAPITANTKHVLRIEIS